MSRVHRHNSAVSRGAALNIVLRLKHPSLQPSTHFFVALTFHLILTPSDSLNTVMAKFSLIGQAGSSTEVNQVSINVKIF